MYADDGGDYRSFDIVGNSTLLHFGVIHGAYQEMVVKT
jgi:hypothetical protein